MTHRISAIVPTIGRADSLAALFAALDAQTRRPDEVIVADGSEGEAIRAVASDDRWRRLHVRCLRVSPPNAVKQRRAAIVESTGSLLLLLDDDVVPEPACVEEMVRCLESEKAVAVGANFSNHDWPPPTTLWRWYLRIWHGMSNGEWQGRVVGPLLRFGYAPVPPLPVAMEWLGAGHTLVRRDAYERAGGFSEFFLHRSTVNEDVDLGLKLGRIGRLVLCPSARMAHLHAPAGRASVQMAAEDDLYNRYCILRYTQQRPRAVAAGLAVTYFVIETLSGLFAGIRTRRPTGFGSRLSGRVRALIRIAAS